MGRSGLFWIIVVLAVGMLFVDSVDSQQQKQEGEIVFVLDSSGSVGSSNFNKIKAFVINIVKFLPIASDEVRIGVISYESSVYHIIRLHQYTTQTSLQNAIRSIPYQGGGTATGTAINAGRVELRSGRANTPKLLVVVTDGKASYNSDPIQPSNAARSEGIVMFAVGIGRTDDAELRAIANDPDQEHMFYVGNFNALESIRKYLLYRFLISVNPCQTCFPGTCDSSAATPCTCSEGFEQGGCDTLNADEQPILSNCEFVYKAPGESPKIILKANCFDDEIYSNDVNINEISMKMTAKYEKTNLPNKPGTVTASELGITVSDVTFTLNRKGLSTPESNGTTKECNSALSETNPRTTSSCDLTFGGIQTSHGHEDTLEVQHTTTNGGYKDLSVTDYQGVSSSVRVPYFGQRISRKMTLVIDLVKPYHCSEPTDTCSGVQNALNIGTTDITDERPTLSAAGWEDALAGIEKYEYSIYKLIKPEGASSLTESSDKTYSTTWRTGDTPPRVTLVTGLYSVILNVYDKAGNTHKARRFVLFDDDSEITTDDSRPIQFPLAHNRGVWQVTGDLIQVDWTNHFVNKIYEDGDLLDSIAEFQGGNIIDDTTGQRRRAEILNKRGVASFEVFKKTHNESLDTKIGPSDGDKMTLDGPLRTQATFQANLEDGEAATVWIKAQDIMGHMKEDKQTVYIDGSPPIIQEPIFEKNVGTFESRITIGAEDEHSGIMEIDWEITGTQAKGKVPITSVDSSCLGNGGSCYCPSILGGETCYPRNNIVPLNNCDFKFLIDRNDYTMRINVQNQAGLTKNRTLQLPPLGQLDGVHYFPHVDNSTLKQVQQDHAFLIISWEEPRSCYNVKEYKVTYQRRDGEGEEVEVKFTSRRGTLEDLDSNTEYVIGVAVVYENNFISDVAERIFKTAYDPNFTGASIGALGGGGIAGIIIGVLVLVGLVVLLVVFLLCRRRKENSGNKQVAFRTNKDIHNRNDDFAMANPCYEEDVYVYGRMSMFGQPWEMKMSNITVIKMLTSGKFADIKLAKNHKDKDKIVVAKMLKDNAGEDEELLMNAKLNFLATAVPMHENIVTFIGGISDGPLGPIILLEYCSEGTLKDWLKRHEHDPEEDLIDHLFQFTLEIAKGMSHLHDHNIIHKKLAARNILVTSDNHAKIYGFGPTTIENENEQKPVDGKEIIRIPLKWLSLETLLSSAGQRYYDKQTDVWAFGVTLWEVFSVGATPYPELKSTEVKQFLSKGGRLAIPDKCPDWLFKDCMWACWTEKPSERPTMGAIKQIIHEALYTTPGDDVYYADS
ncbi:unnamed protein product [Owenia fusiformis]|uniref:Uncharacterized protein n=1 Tax=Owenia fusiformis TaxID=6347 RepID=A0A8J1TGF5_OWEFU|nr:unnamed protein product [Owenia fusiformis]